MRRFLLLVCVLPCLLSAQNTPLKNVLKDKASVQRLLKSLPAPKQEQAVTTRSGTTANLPDSVFAYYDAAKTELFRKTYFKYNELGRPTEERWIEYWDNEPSWEYKTVSSYTRKDGKITVEEITYRLNPQGKWEIAFEKSVFVLNESDLNNPIEIYVYEYDEDADKWILWMQAKAVKFDAGNRPTVYDVEWSFEEEELGFVQLLLRIENAYNAKGLLSSQSMFLDLSSFPFLTEVDPDETWLLMQTIEYFYNASLQLVKEVFTEYDLDPDYFAITTTEYEYDDKGNVNYIRFFFGDDDDDYYYEYFYTNFYPGGTGNEVVLSVKSAIYPNPASDVLYVTVEGIGEAVITLAGMNGSTVYKQKTSRTVTSIPVQSLAKGYYILTIQVGNRTKSHKVIIR